MREMATPGSFCPACGQPVKPGAVFCGNCGQNLSAKVAQSGATAAGAPTRWSWSASDRPDPPPPGTPRGYQSEEGAWVWDGEAWVDDTSPEGEHILAQTEVSEPPPPPPPDPEIVAMMPPAPPDPPGAVVAGSGGGSATGLTLAGMAIVVAGVLIWGISSGTIGGNKNATPANTGVAATSGSIAECTTPAKGYLPGAINCKGQVSVHFSKPYAGGTVSAFIEDYPEAGAFYAGQTVVPVGFTGDVTINVTNPYERVCVLKWSGSIAVFAGPASPAPQPDQLLDSTRFTLDQTSCAYFPQGGLGR